MSRNTDARSEARTRREVGIVRSTLGAERKLEGWADEAFAALCVYAVRRRRPFTIEEFRQDAERAGLTPPPDGRAYGGVIVRALRHSVVRHAGWALAASSNLSPKSTYASVAVKQRSLALRRPTTKKPRSGGRRS
jgi:hypothetical protein